MVLRVRSFSTGRTQLPRMGSVPLHPEGAFPFGARSVRAPGIACAEDTRGGQAGLGQDQGLD